MGTDRDQQGHTLSIPLPERIEARKCLVLAVRPLALILNVENPPQVPDKLAPMMTRLRELIDDGESIGVEHLIKFANIEVGESETDRAIACYRKAAQKAEESHDDRLVAIALSNMGAVLVVQKQFNVALRMLQQAVTHAGNCGELGVKAQALFNMAVVFKQLEQLMMARQSFEQALDAAEKESQLDVVARCLQNLAYFEFSDKELPRAIEYLRRALDVYAMTGNTMDQVRAYYNIGLVYADHSDFTSAIRSLERAREIRNLREVEYEGDRIEQALELVRKRQRDLGANS